ncbi:endolytic transglycosylase MltG [soil metagenome]
MSLTVRGRILLVLGLLGAFLGLLALGAWLYLRSIGLAGDSSPGRRVAVRIPKGASVTHIGSILERRQVVSSAFGFRVATSVENAGTIQAGRYRLHRGLTARDALMELARGPIVESVTVTFPEGSTLEDFAGVLADRTTIRAKRFLALARSGKVRSKYQPRHVRSLEGLLFPSTYELTKKADALSALRLLVGTFDARMSRLGPGDLTPLHVTPYEATIVASMVEAEASVPAERGKVARVIYNRLDDGTPLGIDATILYVLGGRTRQLTEEDLAVDSPYNTRIHIGLPPTPIGSPGLASLRAAVHPPAGSWLYYVLQDCRGHHAFSADYNEFLADKAHYQSLRC